MNYSGVVSSDHVDDSDLSCNAVIATILGFSLAFNLLFLGSHLLKFGDKISDVIRDCNFFDDNNDEYEDDYISQNSSNPESQILENLGDITQNNLEEISQEI